MNPIGDERERERKLAPNFPFPTSSSSSTSPSSLLVPASATAPTTVTSSNEQRAPTPTSVYLRDYKRGSALRPTWPVERRLTFYEPQSPGFHPRQVGSLLSFCLPIYFSLLLIYLCQISDKVESNLDGSLTAPLLCPLSWVRSELPHFLSAEIQVAVRKIINHGAREN